MAGARFGLNFSLFSGGKVGKNGGTAKVRCHEFLAKKFQRECGLSQFKPS